MMNGKSSTDTQKLLKVLWRQISPEKQRKFSFLAIGLMISAVVETFSIGAILPFLLALTASEEIFQHPLLKPFL